MSSCFPPVAVSRCLPSRKRGSRLDPVGHAAKARWRLALPPLRPMARHAPNRSTLSTPRPWPSRSVGSMSPAISPAPVCGQRRAARPVSRHCALRSSLAAVWPHEPGRFARARHAPTSCPRASGGRKPVCPSLDLAASLPNRRPALDLALDGPGALAHALADTLKTTNV
jgi:hypothetical protein